MTDPHSNSTTPWTAEEIAEFEGHLLEEPPFDRRASALVDQCEHQAQRAEEQGNAAVAAVFRRLAGVLARGGRS